MRAALSLAALRDKRPEFLTLRILSPTGRGAGGIVWEKAGGAGWKASTPEGMKTGNARECSLNRWRECEPRERALLCEGARQAEQQLKRRNSGKADIR